MNCIYKLEYKDFYYIGSTNNFKIRLWHHKSNCFNIIKKEYNYKKYKVYRKLGLTKDNFYKELKYEILCDNLYEYEMKVLENEFIDLDDVFCINGYNSNRTEEQIKEYNKKYKKDHKEKIKKQSKEHYQNNKEKIKEQMKEYNQNNKEKINKRRRENYKNK